MIEIKNITKIYKKNKKVALDNVSFKLPQYGLVIIKGRSGSGKTTLLNIIAGYEKQTSGEVLGLKPEDVSMMFQDYKLVDYLTVYENLRLICNLYDVSYNQIDEILKRLEIFELKDHYPNEISLGECLRVSLARALLANKPIILVDEPTKSLDDENVENVYNMLKEVAQSHLVIVVSHDSYFFDENRNAGMIELSGGKLVSTINLDEQDYELPASKMAQIRPKLSLWLSAKIILSNLKRYIMLFVTLVLAFGVLLTSITGLYNSRADVVTSNCKDLGVKRIPLVQMSSKAKVESVIDKEEYLKYSQMESVIPYKYHYLHINESSGYYNIYFTDEFDGWSINDGDILLSEAVAINDYQINDEIEIGGLKYKVKGIYKEADNIDSYTPSFVITPNDLNSLIYRTELSTEVGCSVSGISSTIKMLSQDVTDGVSAIYGQTGKLEGNEIAIHSWYAETLTKDIESLVGKKIEVDFYLYQDGLFRNKIDCKTYEFVVKYIYDSSRFNCDVIASEELTKEIITKYSVQDNRPGAYRLSVSVDDMKLIEKLYANNMLDVLPFSEDIDAGISWSIPMNYILLAVGIVIIIILILIMSNFLISFMLTDKSTMGILASLGISKRKILQTYLLPFILVMLASSIIAVLVQLGGVFGFNQIIKHINKITYNIYVFEATPILILILAIIIIIPLISFKLIRSLKKRSIIDIIYGR